MAGSHSNENQIRHAIHVQQRQQQQQQQQQMSPRMTPTPPTSTSPVASDFCAIGSPLYLNHMCESGNLSHDLQQLQLQQQQQQTQTQSTLLKSYSPSPPLTSVAGCCGINSSGGSIVQGTGRPMGSIVQGTPIVSQGSLVSATPSLGFFNIENSQQRVQGGSIMQGTPFNLPTVPNNLDVFANPAPSLVPISTFAGGSITQGTPVNRMVEVDDMVEVEDMEADAIESDSEPAEEALDLSVRNFKNRTNNEWMCHEEVERKPTFSGPPHPQISITDEQGEVTDMSWSVYALSGKNGTCRQVGLQNLQNDVLSSSLLAGDISSMAAYPELHKSSSGSIEVQLSSDCSQLTVAEIFALIERSIHTKTSGLVSSQMEDAAALLLERPGEDIHIAVEVSPPAGPEGLKGLKIRRISGDYVRYDRICNELIACISM